MNVEKNPLPTPHPFFRGKKSITDLAIDCSNTTYRGLRTLDTQYVVEWTSTDKYTTAYKSVPNIDPNRLFLLVLRENFEI